MKRYSALFIGLLCVAALAAPERAHAAWWVPRVFRLQNPFRGHDVTRYPGFECKMRNAWGDCVVYTYKNDDRSDNHPGGGTPKNYHRRVTSYGTSGLNWSDCNYDDYHRYTAKRTRYIPCDYGEPRTYRVHAGDAV